MLTEVLTYHLYGDMGVFDHIMQQRRDLHLHGSTMPGNNLADCNRVVDVVFTGIFSFLANAAMSASGKHMGFGNTGHS
ncbi:Uncharacterised protein [Salmonella enterica subsp. enterica serovar Typhi]|nr:Uncharacterised protein [Salmonella enterica subsp. enterica serovar Typhi]